MYDQSADMKQTINQHASRLFKWGRYSASRLWEHVKWQQNGRRLSFKELHQAYPQPGESSDMRHNSPSSTQQHLKVPYYTTQRAKELA